MVVAMVYKNIFQERFENLVIQNCIDIELKGFEYASRKIISAIDNFNQLGGWALWGAGEHTKILLDRINFNKSRLKFIVDNKPDLWGEKIKNIPIVSPDEVKNIKSILISTIKQIPQIKQQILSIDNSISIVDIYENEHMYSSIYNHMAFPFWLWNKYYHIHYLRYQYYNSVDLENKKSLLDLIISAFLEIKDIKNARFYMESYSYEFGDKYLNVIAELDSLLTDIKLALSNRNEKDLCFFLYDNLGEDYAANVELMPYISSIKENSAYFSKAYSPSVFTSESLQSIFEGKYRTRYTKDGIGDGVKSSPLIDYLKKNEYITKSYYHVNKPFFNNTYACKDFFTQYQKSEVASEMMWDAVVDLAVDNRKQASFFHFLYETHAPFMGGMHATDSMEFFYVAGDKDASYQQKLFLDRYKECFNYIDSQTKFFFNLLGENVIKIIFADHSRYLEDFLSEDKNPLSLFWHSYAYHIPLIINGKNITKLINDSPFSIIYLTEIVKEICETGNIGNLQKEIAEVSFEGYYNETARAVAIKAGLEDIVDGFTVVINKKYKIVKDSKNNLKYYSMESKEIEAQEITDLCIKDIIGDELYLFIK